MPDRSQQERRDSASAVVAANAEAVWQAFANAKTLMQWLPPGGMTGRALEYDFREGGRYQIELRYDPSAGASPGKTTQTADISTGRFVALERGRTIVQTGEFESDNPAFAGQMRMTWSFEPVGHGTRVTVTAENVPPGIDEADHRAGLRGSLENLARHLRETAG